MVAGDSALADRPFFGHRRAVEDHAMITGVGFFLKSTGLRRPRIGGNAESVLQMGPLAQPVPALTAARRGSMETWEAISAIGTIGSARCV